MILPLLIGILLFGGLLTLLLGRYKELLCRWIALLAVSVDFILITAFWINHSLLESGGWMLHFDMSWIPALGISFKLSLDGLSLLLLVLTFFLGILSVLCSWKEIRFKTGFYYFNLLWILAGITGVFLATDLFLFYFFWELMIIPMYFMINIWGSENKIYASYKFFLFTQLGGLLMLLSILGLYFIQEAKSGEYTFDYFKLIGAELAPSAALLLLLGFMIAFVVKLPIVPFHTWLPDAHGEAPTAGSLILAGLLLKTGAYGIIRFALPLFPQASATIAPYAMFAGVVGIIYGAVLSYSQTDVKRLIAYTSVSHMGFVIFGIFAFTHLALQGVVLQMITHGISTGALFLLAGMLKERLHTRDIENLGGIWAYVPKMGGVALLFAMASLGLPGLGNFVAEFLILLGAYEKYPVLTICASVGLIFSAAYSLRIVQKIFFQPEKEHSDLKDFSFREWLIMGSLSVSIIWIGVYPQTVIDIANPSMIHLKDGLEREASSARDKSIHISPLAKKKESLKK